MVSIEPAWLRHSRRGERLLPHWLLAHDEPWLRRLLAEYLAAAEQPRRMLDARLARDRRESREGPKREIARAVLDRLFRREVRATVAPTRARLAACRAMAALGDRARALRRAAADLGCDPAAVEASLLADLPGERVVVAPTEPPTPAELALHCNLAIARAYVRRSTEVRVRVREGSRDLVRLARWRGLICAVETTGDGDGAVELCVSGPLAILRHTTLYGRALGDLVPRIGHSPGAVLRARCAPPYERGTLELRGDDPIFPGRAPRPFDSKVEARFWRDFRRAAPDWTLMREPEPLQIGRRLLFPDFALRHEPTRRRFLLEIVGFWTSSYLQQKLLALRAAGRRDLLICVDQRRNCADADADDELAVLPFDRWLDPVAVLQRLSAMDPECDGAH